MTLVLVRTPTYRRPVLLKRALNCLQAQTHQDWICEIRDDCPDGSARRVVEEVNDPRVIYMNNKPQKFMIENLDACFQRENSHGADYFFMLEDDNQVRPDYMARGIDIIEQIGVPVCMMNQVIEDLGASGEDRYSTFGIFDGIYDQKTYSPTEIRLALFGWTAMPNGSIFWSKNIRRDLAFRTGTIPGIDEDLRAFRLVDPVYVCLEKLAVWAQDESATNRNLGFDKGRVRREMDMQASARALRRAAWRSTPPAMQAEFLKGNVLRVPMDKRIYEMNRAGIRTPGMQAPIDLRKKLRQKAVDYLGRVHPSIRKAESELTTGV